MFVLCLGRYMKQIILTLDLTIFFSFAEIYRQRKRSKSKVKIQDRKSDKETEENLLATMTSKTASVLGGEGDRASYASQESD